ncbi:cytochrome P450 [Streptomyces sp. NPDC127117]|uniref:cytochrome P450 n=1 Tax=Streptomyces sp. NPDC127117 TaxID=3345368 RepID=UPI0036356917
MTSATAPVPVDEVDLYAESAILEPYGHYRRLRDLGPVVYLKRHGVYALPRYEETRAALTDDDTFRNAGGVSLNDHYNNLILGSTFASDGDEHARLRAITGGRLTPRALRPMRGRVEATADAVVEALVEQGSFDAVGDLARAMVLAVVPDFLGIPDDGREHLIDWAAANFNCHGPLNDRARASLPLSSAMAAYAERLVEERSARPDGVAHCVLDALDRGEVGRDQAVSLMIDYLVPSLDTTVTGLTAAIDLFARHPDQWDLIRQDPALIPGAFREVLRLETPVRAFGRRVARDTEIGRACLPAGSQVLVMFASANRDERAWDRPEEFDVCRESLGHLGFGYGAHGCAGQGLARLETHAVLAALARRVARFEVRGSRRTVNNVMRAFDSLPTRAVPAG